MSLPATLNSPLKLAVSFTLLGAAGSVDANSPIVWQLTPPENGTVTPSADGLTADVTMTVLGDTAITVTADANLASGVLDLVVSDTLQTVEVVNIGADSGVLSIVV
jgi:hypothetical protein